VWVNVYEPVFGESRSGIWRYTPEDGAFQHVLRRAVCPLTWAEDGFLFKARIPGTTSDEWQIFSIQTGDCRTLEGVKTFSPGGIRQPPGWFHLASGVIGGHGRISMPDGKDYQFRGGGWTQPVDRLGRGLVAVSFEGRAFWYIEPKKEEQKVEGRF
jgi:hypothetical protein